jgi:hypothetical protein
LPVFIDFVDILAGFIILCKYYSKDPEMVHLRDNWFTDDVTQKYQAAADADDAGKARAAQVDRALERIKESMIPLVDDLRGITAKAAKAGITLLARVEAQAAPGTFLQHAGVTLTVQREGDGGKLEINSTIGRVKVNDGIKTYDLPPGRHGISKSAELLKEFCDRALPELSQADLKLELESLSAAEKSRVNRPARPCSPPIKKPA